MEKIREVKDAWAAYVNTDLTEGRGQQYPLCISYNKATCIRIGHRQNVQGSNAEIRNVKLFKIDNEWYGPFMLTWPSKEDDRQLGLMNEKESVIKKAKELGLTDEEISQLSR